MKSEDIRCYRNVSALFIKSSVQCSAEGVDANSRIKKLYETMGHVNRRTLKQIVNNKLIDCVD